MEIYKLIILAIAAYFIGSISFSYIFAKNLTGKDIRNLNVKNAGAFNVFLSVGPLVGIIVGLLDASKTFLILIIANAWGLDIVSSIVAASFGIVGHCFPIYYGFHGGKGAGTVVGIFIYFIPLAFFIALVPAILIAFSIRRMGLTPLFFILLSPFVAYLLHKPEQLVNAMIFVSLLTGLLNLVIFLTKRDRRVVVEQ